MKTKRVMVLLLGENDYPVAPHVYITDTEMMDALDAIVAAEQSRPTLSDPIKRSIAAVLRVGAANLLRMIRNGAAVIGDDGKIKSIPRHERRQHTA